MAHQTPPEKPIPSSQVLDLLLDALLERQADRQKGGPEDVQSKAAKPSPAQGSILRTVAPVPSVAPSRKTESAPPPAPDPWQPPPRQPHVGLERTLSRFLLLVVLLLVVVNVPVTRYGASLARVMPDSASLVIRDGLVLKGSGPEIYILQEDRLRWISSLDAFDHLGLEWRDVHVVDDAFLQRFEVGRPIHVLLKCAESPHIYRLENDQKRWIRDIDVFLAEGHVWDDVRFVDCGSLRAIPDGPPIPEDAGPPPRP